MRISDWSSDVCSSDLGQAISMLQIADGAMSKVQDILVRMKTLAVQAGSGQLSNTERSMLNTEYTSLLEEVERISRDTELNGNQVINGSVDITSNATFRSDERRVGQECVSTYKT